MARRSSFTFDSTAKIYRPRTRFNLSHEKLLTMNVGTLYPIDIQEAYPGDEFIDRDAMVSRLVSSYLRPNMGNLFMDVHVFFVPLRLVFEDFASIFGNASPSQYSSPEYATMPAISDLSGNCHFAPGTGTVSDNLYGLAPTGSLKCSQVKVSLAPARAFALIYDEWFRDENNVLPMQIQKGAAADSEAFNTRDWSPNNYTGKLPKVRKIHDYFTSCLPAPQKGPEATIGFATSAPVVTGEDWLTGGAGVAPETLRFYHPSGVVAGGRTLGLVPDTPNNSSVGLEANSNMTVPGINLAPSNLYADLSHSGATTINDIRLAFQTQRILERDARTGSRYAEYIRAAFGVSPSDARLQRPEYIAGWRLPMAIHQVPQTSAGTDTSPLASLAAYGQSQGKGRWHKAAAEHGYFISVACIRQLHVYQQGCERFLTRLERDDFYDPEYAYLGEQPVYKSELYFVNGDTFSQIFGYNEAFADLRYRPSQVCGQARSGAKLLDGSNSDLDIWHLGDKYNNAPTLNEQFIEETPIYVDRGISVPSTSQDQFLVNFYFKRDGIRPLPARGTPGLIDHTYGRVR